MKHLIIALASLLSLSSYGQFGTEQELSSMPEGTAIVSVDLDNDGLKDLVGCWRHLYWFKNLGSGRFSKKLNIRAFDYATNDNDNEFRCKDLNADGLPDVLRYNNTTHGISILVNTGGGTFASQEVVLTTASNDPTEVSLEDFNGDGTVDVLAFQSTAMVLYLNAGGMAFTGSSLSFPGASFLGGAAPADYDNDGDIDLVLTNCTNSLATIDFFANNGSAAFSPAFSVATGSNCLGRLIAEDIDQDNDLDLVYNLNAGIYLRKNNGSNTYGAAVSIATVYTGGGDPFSFKLGDLNGDGIKDLVTCYGDSGGGGDWLKLTPGIAGGSFGTATTIVHQPWQQTGFVLDDMDADGKKDIVSLSVVNFVLSWLKNNGSGGFPQQTELSNQGKLARVMQTAVNNDGYDDLFIISLNKIQGNTLYAMYRLGTATGLSDSVIYVSGLYGQSVGEMQSVDLDTDGDMDVVYSYFPNSGYGGVAWLRNDGNGSYTSLLISSTANSGSLHLDVGDLNGDGLPDLLYAGLSIYWARNNGNGTFTQFTVTASFSSVRSLLIADANHDGMNDIVFGHTMVSYLPRTGPTTFGTQVNVSASALYYEHLLPVDVNNDGATDILCSTYNGTNRLSQVRLNDGAGGFSTIDNAIIPDYVTNMVLFDVDEDGQQELVMSFNNGNFGLAEPLNTNFGPVQVVNGTTTYPIRGICLLNVDDDQHRDLVYDQDVVSVYFRKNELFTCAALDLDSLQLESCGPGTVAAVSPHPLQWSVQGQPTQNTSHFSWNASAPGTYALDVTLPANAGCPVTDTALSIRIYPRYDSIPLSPLTICEGDTATFFGAPQWLAGVYAHPLQTVHGCDSIEYRQLIVTPRPHIALTGMNAASCAGQPVSGSSETALHWTIAGETTQSGSTFSWSTANPGTYTLVVSLDSTGVCGTTDSSLTVTVHPRFDSLVVSPVAICQGGSALIFGVSRSVAGTYSNPLQTVHGCDSVLYQELIVHPAFDSLVLEPVSVCSGGSALIFGVPRSVAGTYSNPLQTIHGCDSVLYQQLIVHPGYDSLVVNPVSVCSGESALIFGVSRSVAGTYSNALQTVHGCDSILYQQLIVHPGYDSIALNPVSVCQGGSALIFGVSRSVTGTYSNPLQTVHGCDSILYQELIVDPLPVVAMDAFAEDTICLKEGSLALPDAVPAGGAYSGTGVVGGTFQPVVAGAGTFGISYTFTDPDGCSNAAVSFITVDECLGIDEQATPAIRVHPNPTSGLLTVQWTNGLACILTVTDYSGREVIRKINAGGFSQELDMDACAPGTYFLKVVFSDGSTFLEKVVRI